MKCIKRVSTGFTTFAGHVSSILCPFLAGLPGFESRPAHTEYRIPTEDDALRHEVFRRGAMGLEDH